MDADTKTEFKNVALDFKYLLDSLEAPDLQKKSLRIFDNLIGYAQGHPAQWRELLNEQFVDADRFGDFLTSVNFLVFEEKPSMTTSPANDSEVSSPEQHRDASIVQRATKRKIDEVQSQGNAALAGAKKDVAKPAKTETKRSKIQDPSKDSDKKVVATKAKLETKEAKKGGSSKASTNQDAKEETKEGKKKAKEETKVGKKKAKEGTKEGKNKAKEETKKFNTGKTLAHTKGSQASTDSDKARLKYWCNDCPYTHDNRQNVLKHVKLCQKRKERKEREAFKMQVECDDPPSSEDEDFSENKN